MDAVKKIHLYIYGGGLTIITDHKTLLGILVKNESVPITAASRIQKWVIMSAFDYSIT